MSEELIVHSPDLLRLRQEGYELDVHNGYAIIHNVPYVNSKCEICRGDIISTLMLAGNTTTTPDNHVVYFKGEYPCDGIGSEIAGIRHQTLNSQLSPEVYANFAFSNRPPEGFSNYYDKLSHYVRILSSHAKFLDASVTAQTFRKVVMTTEDSVFQYYDTNSSKSNIAMISGKLAGMKIGIIGLGGTGSYILDLVAKTPVAEIHIFDGDDLLQHNSFRSPGAPTKELLKQMPKKVSYFASIYANMHKHIIPYSCYIDETNLEQLANMNFVFISIDKGSVKRLIVDYLLLKNIPFIDTGIGVEVVDDSLIGSVRMTACSPDKKDHISSRIPFSDSKEDLYSSNIQIAELNSLNAVLAVIKWKKMLGFYQDLVQEYNNVYELNVGALIKDDGLF